METIKGQLEEILQEKEEKNLIVLMLKYLIVDRYREIRDEDVLKMLDLNFNRWMERPDKFQRELNISMKLFAIYKRLNDRHNSTEVTRPYDSQGYLQPISKS